MRKALVLAIIAVTVVFTACRSNLIQVRTEFDGLSMEGREKGALRLKVINLNKFGLSIEELDYTMLLGRDTLASGTRPEPISVAGQDTTAAEFPFDMRFDIADTSFFMRPGLLSDTVTFKLAGRYVLPGFLKKNRVPFRYSKGIPVGDIIGGSTTDLNRLFNQ